MEAGKGLKEKRRARIRSGGLGMPVEDTSGGKGWEHERAHGQVWQKRGRCREKFWGTELVGLEQLHLPIFPEGMMMGNHWGISNRVGGNIRIIFFYQDNPGRTLLF